MTRAAYTEAIEWSAITGQPLVVECDVQLSADQEPVCLHDLTVNRTSNGSGRASDHTVAELKTLDFGSWAAPRPSADQRELLTLRELMSLVRTARAGGMPISLAIETKHPRGRGRLLEERVADLVTEFDWHRPGSPARVISFSVKAVKRVGSLLPAVPRTLLIEDRLGPWATGRLPDGVEVVGLHLPLLKTDPGYADRLARRGNRLHVWTVNTSADAAFCLDLGVESITTDDPSAVAAVTQGRLPVAHR